LSKKDFDCWHNQLNCGTHRDSLVNFTPLGVTTQESPAFRHGECQLSLYVRKGVGFGDHENDYKNSLTKIITLI
ncbi:hypothetical protein, partial [Brevibacillus laterosporus]|nr:hypothetical protein [Brevibacillus laterosporus]